MKVEVDVVSQMERKLRVELPADLVSKEFARMYQQLGARAKVKGFRQGKVPRRVLEGLYGTEVHAQTLSGLVERSLAQALRENELHVVGQPRVETGELREGEAFSFSAAVEVKPDIELHDYKGIAVERVRMEVEDEQVEASLRRLQDHHAQLEPVEARDIVAEGDFIVIDFNGTIDGEPFPGGDAQNFPVGVGERKTIPAFERALVGLQKDREAVVDVHLPEDFGDVAVAGKDAKFRVRVTDIKRKILPELDDEFAKDYGDCQSLEELREKIRTELKRELDALQTRQLKDQIVQRLVDSHDFTVPPSLVERELSRILDRAEPDAAAEASTTEERKDALRPEAARRVKTLLLLEKVAAVEHIDASAEELRERVNLIARAAGDRAPAVREYYAREDVSEALKNQIISEKTLEFLLQHATIREVEPASKMVDAVDEKG